MQKILAKLQKARIPIDVNKCKSHVIKTKYLGLMISTDSIKIDPAKINAIKQWDIPICVKEIRSFIDFCNFYCQLIRDFSKIAGPLNALIKKELKFKWSEKYDQMFKSLKQKICEAPILTYFDLSKQCHQETDLSNYVSAGVLSQKSEDGLLHPIVYFSKIMMLAKCNYKIYDKELLAIIWCLKK